MLVVASSIAREEDKSVQYTSLHPPTIVAPFLSGGQFLFSRGNTFALGLRGRLRGCLRTTFKNNRGNATVRFFVTQEVPNGEKILPYL